MAVGILGDVPMIVRAWRSVELLAPGCDLVDVTSLGLPPGIPSAGRAGPGAELDPLPGLRVLAAPVRLVAPAALGTKGRVAAAPRRPVAGIRDHPRLSLFPEASK